MQSDMSFLALLRRCVLSGISRLHILQVIGRHVAHKYASTSSSDYGSCFELNGTMGAVHVVRFLHVGSLQTGQVLQCAAEHGGWQQVLQSACRVDLRCHMLSRKSSFGNILLQHAHICIGSDAASVHALHNDISIL